MPLNRILLLTNRDINAILIIILKLRRRTWFIAHKCTVFSNYSGLGHPHPLFPSPALPMDSRISAAWTMPVADNFLQKQQKQRERRLGATLLAARQKPLRCGGEGILPRFERRERDDDEDTIAPDER